MSSVTLIGTRLAEVGQTFVYHGEAPGCAGCPYRSQCLNLTEGARYRVTAVRDDAQVLECAVHDTGVRAVEVTPVSTPASVPTDNAYEGSRVQLAGPCPHTSCPSHEYCEPAGVDFDTEFQITNIQGEPPHEYCHLDRELMLVSLDHPDTG